tara:strand:- start:21677 stop:23233 length:1557 start_codon:yes stop_codon:yes gene_type:complete
MGSYSVFRNYNSSVSVPSSIKSVYYIAVGGGGGGGYPNIPVFSGNFTSPQAGQYSCIGGAIAYGGNPGSWYSGGTGGYGNYRYGQTGRFGGGPWNRAASGYGQYGYGGSGQWRGSSSSYGGGGGGASCCTLYRGQSGASPGQTVYAVIGQGGTQGGSGNCRYGNAGATYAFFCTYDTPYPTISASPTAFRLNGTDGLGAQTSLSWSTGGGDSDSEILERLQSGVVVESYGQVNRSGSLTVAPTATSDFRFTTSNPAFSNSSTVTITVYQPPTINFAASSTTIVTGASTILSWNVTGDVNNVNIDPGVGTSNLNSSVTVSPTVDTLYTLTASGLGGTGSAQIQISVLSLPTITVSGPINVLYGEDIQINLTVTNSEGGVSYVAEYLYTDGTNEYRPSESIPNTIGEDVTVFAHTVPVTYSDFGPFKVRFIFTVDGYGNLTTTDNTLEVPIIIDQIPDVISIPESEDTFKDEQPVVSPDVEVTTDLIVINDIDIPVEIKADYPIQIEIDNSSTWQDIREI